MEASRKGKVQPDKPAAAKKLNNCYGDFDFNCDAIVMVHFEFGQNFTFSEIIFQENQHFLKLSII